MIEEILRGWLGERFRDAERLADRMDFVRDPEMVQGEGEGRHGTYAPSAKLGAPETFCNCPFGKAGGLCYHKGALFLRALREGVPSTLLFPALSSCCPHRVAADPPTCKRNEDAPGECRMELCYWRK